MRLINADKLEKKAKFNLQTGNFIKLSDLQKAPTIDAEPVVHGHWKKLDDNGRELATPYCSQCLHLPLRNNGYAVELTDYCPYCGAKMDEEAEQ